MHNLSHFACKLQLPQDALSFLSGIATFADKPWNATDYIHPLLDYASSHVPKSKHRETPVFILATAGMRMIPKPKQNAILDDLRVNIPKRYNFHLSPSQVEVISGKQEGWYARNNLYIFRLIALLVLYFCF